MKDFLAEDFVMGKLAAERGDGVILSSYVIEHRIGAQPFAANLRHRLRWNRSTRRSRPWGYVGQIFTNPLPPALLLWAVKPEWWPVMAATVLLRAVAGVATAAFVLRDPLAASLVSVSGCIERSRVDGRLLRQHHFVAQEVVLCRRMGGSSWCGERKERGRRLEMKHAIQVRVFRGERQYVASVWICLLLPRLRVWMS